MGKRGCAPDETRQIARILDGATKEILARGDLTSKSGSKARILFRQRLGRVGIPPSTASLSATALLMPYLQFVQEFFLFRVGHRLDLKSFWTR